MIKYLFTAFAVLASLAAIAQPTTVPTPAGNDIVSIYSSALGNTPGYFFDSWGGGQGETVSIDGKETYKISAFNYFGSQFVTAEQPSLDVSNKKYLHVDIYPMQDMKLAIVMINKSSTGNYGEKGWNMNLTANEWNSVDLEVQALIDRGCPMSSLWQIKYVREVVAEGNGAMASDGFANGNGTETFYVGNLYFHGTRVVDTEAPVLVTAQASEVGGNEVTLKLMATDNNADITYVITDAANNKTYEAKGAAGEEIEYTITGLKSNTDYSLTIQAKDVAGLLSEAMTVTFTTLDGFVLSPAPTPTVAAENVLSIFSDAYTPATTYNPGSWGQSTQIVAESVAGDNLYHLINYNYLGFDYANPIDLSEMDYLHIDVLPMDEVALGVTPILQPGNGAAGTENPQKVGTLTIKQWNSIDIPLSQFGLDFTSALSHQFKFDGGTANELYFDNLYFYKKSGEEPPTPSGLVDQGMTDNNVHKLVGVWDADDFAAIDAEAQATAYDLTDVEHVGTIDVIGKTANPFCLFLTASPGTVNRNEVVANVDGGYNGFALFFQEEPNSSKPYDLNTMLAPITVTNPFFQRLFVDAQNYVTMTVPFDYDHIPDAAAGTKFFAMNALMTENGETTIYFKEVDAIEANVPYLVYCATGGITIPDPGTVTMTLQAQEVAGEAGNFVGNYTRREVAPTSGLKRAAGSRVYVQADAKEDALGFTPAGDAEIRPFRAMILTDEPANVINVSFDDPTIATGISELNDAAMSALFNVYTIDGRQVKRNSDSMINLPAGIYIINGKKVFVK